MSGALLRGALAGGLLLVGVPAAALGGEAGLAAAGVLP